MDALGAFSENMWTGLGAMQLGLRLDNGGENIPVATFIDRGAAGDLSRVRDGANMETEGGIACDEGATSDAHLLPCPVCIEEVGMRR